MSGTKIITNTFVHFHLRHFLYFRTEMIISAVCMYIKNISYEKQREWQKWVTTIQKKKYYRKVIMVFRFLELNCTNCAKQSTLNINFISDDFYFQRIILKYKTYPVGLWKGIYKYASTRILSYIRAFRYRYFRHILVIVSFIIPITPRLQPILPGFWQTVWNPYVTRMYNRVIKINIISSNITFFISKNILKCFITNS